MVAAAAIAVTNPPTVSGEAHAPASQVGFTWSVPDRLRQDPGRQNIGEYATKPGMVTTGPWRVDFRVDPDECRPDARYRWTVLGKTYTRLGCRFNFPFPR